MRNSPQRSTARACWTGSRLIALVLSLVLFAAPRAMASGVSIDGLKIISRNTPLPSSCDGLRQETDTMIAVDPDRPRHLIATWDQDDHKSNVTASSRDGGKSWRISSVP